MEWIQPGRFVVSWQLTGRVYPMACVLWYLRLLGSTPSTRRIKKCRMWAENYVQWSGVSHDVENMPYMWTMVSTLEPMTPSDIPRQKVGTDLFQQGDTSLLVVDHLLGYHEVKISSTTSLNIKCTVTNLFKIWGLSLAELLVGRHLSANLPLLTKQLVPDWRVVWKASTMHLRTKKDVTTFIQWGEKPCPNTWGIDDDPGPGTVFTHC